MTQGLLVETEKISMKSLFWQEKHFILYDWIIIAFYSHFSRDLLN